jgi:predicted phage-related endonuclease
MLSAAEEDYRIGKFTGSLANAVMSAKNDAELVAIWRQKVGLDPPQPETWAMRAGAHMERLILDERELQTGQAITRRGEIVDHPSESNICVKLDGFRAADNAVIEAKFLSAFYNRDDFLSAYAAQVTLQMICQGVRTGYLVVAQGTSDPIEHEILWDDDYAGELMRRAKAFIRCMRTLTPPAALPPVCPPERWRTIDIIAAPTNWSAEMLVHLDEYQATAEHAERHDAAGKAARLLVPHDVGRISAGAWALSRDKRGVISIRRNAAREAA